MTKHLLSTRCEANHLRVVQRPRPAIGKTLLVFQLLLALMITSYEANATHFRYGNVTWRPISGNTVQFKLSLSFRTSYQEITGSVPVGRVIPSSSLGSSNLFVFGDNTTTPFSLTVTSINTAEDWFYGEAIITKTYNTTGNFTAYFQDCCRLSRVSSTSGLQNNFDANYRVETTVTVGNGNNAPVSTSPPIVYLPVNLAAAAFTIPGFDPDGDPVTFRVASLAETGGTAPAGFSVNALTGVATFSTIGKVPGQFWNASVAITDNKGAKTIVDFLMQITPPSNPPTFDYTVTPTNGRVYRVSPGTPVSFTVRARDTDLGDNVFLQAVGLPPGASLMPTLPTSGNPTQTVFSWTPTISELGTNVINFIAQDNQNAQRTTSVSIQVSLAPTFDVPPTPPYDSYIVVAPGTPVSQSLSASDPDPNDKVQIISVSGLPGATFSPSLPTPAANPTTTRYNWTPTPAQWGINSMTVTARDTYTDQARHILNYIVNTPPAFVSTQANTTILAGQPHSYTIRSTDADIPYGDKLKLISGGLPGWLTLTDNGDGTGTLTGTPAPTDEGSFQIALAVADEFHHDGGIARQEFTITVINCTISLNSLATPVGCPGGNDGAIDLSATGATAPVTYSWSNGATTEDLGNLTAGTYSVTVADGKSCTATATIAVTTTPDQTPPNAQAKPLTIQLNAQGMATISVTDVNNGSSDACGPVSLTLSKTSFTCSNIGPNSVTLTVADQNGNVSTATTTITVEDKVAPSAIVKSVTVQLDAQGTATISAAEVDNGSSDTCGPVSLSLSKTSFDCSNIGANSVLLTVTDTHGNVSTAPSTVTVEDKVAPSAVAKSITIQLNEQGTASVNATDVNNGSSDICGPVSLGLSKTSFDCSTIGPNSVILTVTDRNGNVSTATATVTVEDKIKPTLNCPTGPISRCIEAAGVYTIPSLSATDNCSIATTTYAISGATNRAGTGADASGSFAVGVSTITWTVTDAGGNQSQCSSQVVVSVGLSVSIANVNPIGQGAQPNTIYLGYGPSSLQLTASTNGGQAPYRYLWTGGSSQSTLGVSEAGTYAVTVTDANGCVASYSININVVNVRCGNKDDKVSVCQKTNNDKNPWNQICVSENAVDAHLKNGSMLGQCGTGARIGVDTEAISPMKVAVGPNPTSDAINVVVELSQPSPLTMEVYDLRGHLRQSRSVEAGGTKVEQKLNFGNYQSGFYLLQISSDTEKQTVKIIKHD